MVSYENVARLPEAEDMVRRDPKLRDKFPPLHRFEGIATDQDRERHAIPSHARLNVPLCMTIEEVKAWSEKLYTLAQDIKIIADRDGLTEIEKLSRIKMEVGALNRDTLADISANRERYYERKGKEK